MQLDGLAWRRVLDGVLYDACAGKDFVRALCEAMPRRRSFNGGSARLRAFPTNALRTAAAEDGVTRVHLEAEGAARSVIRRFRDAFDA